MSYFPEMDSAYAEFKNWLALLKERGGDASPYERRVDALCRRLAKRLAKEVEAAPVIAREPSDLAGVRALRPAGPRRLVDGFEPDALRDKLLGAWLGRAAGCILGIPCEGMAKPRIRAAARAFGMRYPLDDYWTADPGFRGDDAKHYGVTPRRRFLKGRIRYAGADDDLAYTLLGLLILEEHGLDFTTEDVAAAWLRYLPLACTAEYVAWRNLKQGAPASESGRRGNPYCDWIGADIRSDPWAYAAPGFPEKAAEFAHRDAFISHRAAGVHGAMFFSAAISAAFALDDPVDALRAGLAEIPTKSRMAQCVKETLKWCEADGDWDQTTDRILSRYAGMAGAHTLNNAALTVAGVFYGEKRFGRTIALTVMGGVDTDCTGATAGSLLGAVLGARRLRRAASKWIQPLGRRAQTYLIGRRWWTHEDIAERFARIAERVLAGG